MNKVYNINLAERIFTLNDDAYALLSAYLEIVNQAYGSSPDGKVVIGELEGRIAASLPQEGIIKIEQINQILDLIGTPAMTQKARNMAYKQAQAQQATTPEEGEDEADKPSTFARVLRIILRIAAGIVAGILSYWWIVACGMAIALSLAGNMIGWGIISEEIFDEAIHFGVSVVQFIIGFASLPWLLAIYLLFCFAFNAQIRKWVLWGGIGLWLLIMVLLGTGLSNPNSTDTSTLEERIEMSIENPVERIRDKADAISDSLERKAKRLERISKIIDEEL